MCELREPRKVRGKPIVEGEVWLKRNIKPLDSIPGLTIQEIEEDKLKSEFAIQCKNEKIAHSLAKLMRDMGL